MDNILSELISLRNELDKIIHKMGYVKPTPLRHSQVTHVDNSVSKFLNKIYDIDGQISRVLYTDYCVYCNGLGVSPINHIEFSRQVNRTLSSVTVVKRFGKRCYRVFSKKGGG